LDEDIPQPGARRDFVQQNEVTVGLGAVYVRREYQLSMERVAWLVRTILDELDVLYSLG